VSEEPLTGLTWEQVLSAAVGAVGTLITVSVTTVTDPPRPVAQVGGLLRGDFPDEDADEAIVLMFAGGNVVLDRPSFKAAAWVTATSP